MEIGCSYVTYVLVICRICLLFLPPSPAHPLRVSSGEKFPSRQLNLPLRFLFLSFPPCHYGRQALFWSDIKNVHTRWGKEGLPLAHGRKITVAYNTYTMCRHHMRVPLFLSPFGPSQSWFHTWCCRCCSCSARHSLYLSRAT